MKQKFLLTFICLVCGFSLTAQTIQWGYVGNIKTEERGKNGYLYKASTNDILHHQAQHKINALYLNFYERKKDKKKEKNRYCLIEFQAAMSPRTDDYARFPHDANAPFWNLAFGFHEDVKTPDNYGGMDVLVAGALYRNDWTVRHKEGVEHISQKNSGNTFRMPNDYISYRGISCRFAPVKIQILLDSIEKKIWFYLNGVLQNEVPFIHKQPYYIPGTFVLFWEKHKNNRDRRIFELSPATVEHLNEKPEITPAPIKGIYYSGVLSDTEYETAWQLLFGGKNDWKKGFSSMKHLADREHAAAAFDLACCYARGIGCQPDLKLALEYAEKAAEMDIPEAASLYLELAKEKYLPGDMQKELQKKKFLQNNNEFRLLTDQENLISIKNNPKVYARSIIFTLPKVSAEQKKLLLAELKKIANQGYPFAMYLCSRYCDSEKERADYLQKAIVSREPHAIRDMIARGKKKLSDFDLLSQLAYAETFLLEYAGIKEKVSSQEARRLLQGRKKYPAGAFALAEFLLLPGFEAASNTRYEAAVIMASAAKTDPLAQIVYIRRYLEGDYGEKKYAEWFMKQLLKNHKGELYIEELKLLLLEKWYPKKWKKDWIKLAKKRSAAAFYHLGEYSESVGEFDKASWYRSEFLKEDAKRRNDSGFGIFHGPAAQSFAGYLK